MCPWGFVHFVFSFFFSLLFRLRGFYYSILNFSTSFLHPLHYAVKLTIEFLFQLSYFQVLKFLFGSSLCLPYLWSDVFSFAATFYLLYVSSVCICSLKHFTMAALKPLSDHSNIYVIITSADFPFSFRDLPDSWYNKWFLIENWTFWVLQDSVFHGHPLTLLWLGNG